MRGAARFSMGMTAPRRCPSRERAGTGLVDVPAVLHCPHLPCGAVGVRAKNFCLKQGLEGPPLYPHSLRLGLPAAS